MTSAQPESATGEAAGEEGPGGRPLSPVVAAIINSAAAAAAQRADTADITHGLVSALRHLRAAIDDQAGFAMAASMDNAIQARIMVENLRGLRLSGSPPPPVRLPPVGAGAVVASAIFESAAESCLAVNALAPDNEPLEHAIVAFTAQLFQRLGGMPEWGELKAALHRPHGRASDIVAAVLPATGATLH